MSSKVFRIFYGAVRIETIDWKCEEDKETASRNFHFSEIGLVFDRP